MPTTSPYIPPSSAVSPTAPSINTTPKATDTQLDKNAFLKLLTAQLKYQDPMNPMSNQDFIGQMAQFSSLEQITNLATAQSSNLLATQMSQGVQMIGKTVKWTDADGNAQTGTVASVISKDGKILLKVGTAEVSVGEVSEVTA